MNRIDRIIGGSFVLVVGLGFVAACSSAGSTDGGPSLQNCLNGGDCTGTTGVDPDAGPINTGPGRPDDNIKNGTETDVDCGGSGAPKCAVGKSCLVDGDCTVACNYAKKCIDTPSCKPRLGGDTCGKGEVGLPGATHESCCKTLPVPGFVDAAHPGKKVYLDKYEITTGRIRAFINDIAAKTSGRPDLKEWLLKNKPQVWDNEWTKFLPSDFEGGRVRIDRMLLGDRRPGAETPPPELDQDQNVGVNYQFNGQLFVYLHGNNCSTAENSFSFPTFFYPANVLVKQGPQTFPPRVDGTLPSGGIIPASEHLEVKSVNCISNLMLQAFCSWDGGQLATDEVLDFVTASPPTLGYAPGCGTQVSENPPSSDAATKGGRCADLASINATYDAGGQLPTPDHPLNVNRYVFPEFPGGITFDKAWEISAPGRVVADTVRINPNDEPWMDIAGNLSEAALQTSDGAFSGKFTLKYRGIGYSSSRSQLNVKDDWEGEGGVRRIERGEARAAFAGGRCMRFK